MYVYMLIFTGKKSVTRWGTLSFLDIQQHYVVYMKHCSSKVYSVTRFGFFPSRNICVFFPAKNQKTCKSVTVRYTMYNRLKRYLIFFIFIVIVQQIVVQQCIQRVYRGGNCHHFCKFFLLFTFFHLKNHLTFDQISFCLHFHLD